MKNALLFCVILVIFITMTGCNMTGILSSGQGDDNPGSNVIVPLSDDVYLSEESFSVNYGNGEIMQFKAMYDENCRITMYSIDDCSISHTFDEYGRVITACVTERGETRDYAFNYIKMDNPNLEDIHDDVVWNHSVMSILSVPRTLYVAQVVSENGKELEKPFFSEELQYHYDNKNRLIGMGFHSSQWFSGFSLVYEYYPDGNVKTILSTKDPSSGITVIDYDEIGRKESERHYFISDSDGVILSSCRYYSENGQPIKMISYDFSTPGTPTEEWFYENGIFKKAEAIDKNGERAVSLLPEFSKEKDGIKCYITKKLDGTIYSEDGYDQLNRIVSRVGYDSDGNIQLKVNCNYYENTNEITLLHECIYKETGAILLIRDTEKLFKKIK